MVVVRRYEELCSDTGEPFVPMTVDPVLGNPEVALRQVGNGDPVIKWAPTAKDLYGRGQGVYLDFAGEALRPGCVYATDSARYTSLTQSAVYAHIAQQPDRPGFLAVQYWIYWYYNDWNNKHESDWEFIQVLFRASSVDQALTHDPISVGYAQHEGGEVSDWTSDKLEHDGTHPVVYSSQRSHASYVQAALYLGRGASEGFGCDNTQTPSTRVRPRVVVLPDAPSGPDDPFAWLAFNGRWGERQSDPNNGPTGPTGKPRWSEPVTWQEGLRESSFAIPGGSAAPPAIVSTFCTVVGEGSVLFIEFMASPAKVLLALAVLALVFAFLVRRTSWRRVDPLPVVARRAPARSSARRLLCTGNIRRRSQRLASLRCLLAWWRCSSASACSTFRSSGRPLPSRPTPETRAAGRSFRPQSRPRSGPSPSCLSPPRSPTCSDTPVRDHTTAWAAPATR